MEKLKIFPMHEYLNRVGLSEIAKNLKAKEQIPNGIRDEEKFKLFCRAIELSEVMVSRGIWHASYDDPRESKGSHFIHIHLDEDIIDDMDTMGELFEIFSDVMFSGDSRGNVSITFRMDAMYKESR